VLLLFMGDDGSYPRSYRPLLCTGFVGLVEVLGGAGKGEGWQDIFRPDIADIPCAPRHSLDACCMCMCTVRHFGRSLDACCRCMCTVRHFALSDHPTRAHAMFMISFPCVVVRASGCIMTRAKSGLWQGPAPPRSGLDPPQVLVESGPRLEHSVEGPDSQGAPFAPPLPPARTVGSVTPCFGL
jgi:hypothetical protein